MDKWVQLNNQAAGRDKIARLIQYASRALAYSLEESKVSLAYSDKLKTLEYILSTFRKLLRFGKCFDVFYGSLKTIHHPDIIIRITLTVGKLSQSLFLLADHFMWIARTGLVKNIDVKRWSELSNRYWLLSIIMNLCRDFYEIVRLMKLHKSSIKSGIAQSRKVKSMKELGQLGLYSYSLVLAHKDVFVDTLKNSCDFFIPYTALGYGKLSNSTIGMLGTISSIAGLIALWDPTAKLVPM